jgi:Ca-activated chloride channel family protein
VVIGLGEDPERAAWRIVSRTRAPIVVELEIEGSALIDHAPSRLPDLFAGAPALIGVSLRPEGGELRVRGRTAGGVWERRVHVPATAAGEGSQAAAALFGREAVEDLEMRRAAGEDGRSIDAGIERLGLDFQIATRLTSWVAVSQEITVDGRDPLRRERMPHELPYGMSAEGLGLRPAQGRSSAGRGRVAVLSLMDDVGEIAEEEVASVVSRERSYEVHRPKPMSLTSPFMPPPGAPPPAASAAPAPAKGPVVEDKKVDHRTEQASSMPRPADLGAPEDAHEGFLGRVRRFFSKPTEPAPTLPRMLRGHVALQKPDALIFEVAVDGAPLDWAPEGAVELELEDGSTVRASVVSSLSTRAGRIEPGRIARLGVAVRGMLAAGVRRVILRRGGAEIVIDLS